MRSRCLYGGGNFRQSTTICPCAPELIGGLGQAGAISGPSKGQIWAQYEPRPAQNFRLKVDTNLFFFSHYSRNEQCALFNSAWYLVLWEQVKRITLRQMLPVSGGGDTAWKTCVFAQPSGYAQQLPDNLHGFYCLREQSLGKSLCAVKPMCYFSPNLIYHNTLKYNNIYNFIVN